MVLREAAVAFARDDPGAGQRDGRESKEEKNANHENRVPPPLRETVSPWTVIRAVLRRNVRVWVAQANRIGGLVEVGPGLLVHVHGPHVLGGDGEERQEVERGRHEREGEDEPGVGADERGGVGDRRHHHSLEHEEVVG